MPPPPRCVPPAQDRSPCRRGRRPLLAALVALLATAAPAGAQEDGGAPLDLASLGIKGHAIFKNFSHFRETPLDNRNFREEAILQLEWSSRFARAADLKLVGEAREDDDRFARGVTFRIPDTEEHRSVLGLKEAVLAVSRSGARPDSRAPRSTRGTSPA